MIKCYELTNRLPTGLMDNAISRVAFATENLKMDLMVLHCSTKLWTHVLECEVLQLKFSWSRASVCWRITRKWFNRQLSDDWARLWMFCNQLWKYKWYPDVAKKVGKQSKLNKPASLLCVTSPEHFIDGE